MKPSVDSSSFTSKNHAQNPLDGQAVNPEAERAVIAALFRNPDGREIIRLGITPDLFALDATREAFRAITALAADGIPPDAATISRAVSPATKIEIETSLQAHVSAANLPVYVKLLKNCHRERQVQAARDRLMKAAAAGAPEHELQAILESIKQISAGIDADPNRPPPFRPFTEEELTAAHLTPKCIVENYLYSDLALVAAAGGTGKTTLLIYEAVCIALGMDLWGNRVITPGATLFVTAEDQSDLFAARLNAIMNAMNLSAAAREQARLRITVWDVTGSLLRLAELDKHGNIQLTGLADSIVEAYRDAGLVQVVFDPAISFGPGERVINDGEQAVVVACRRIVKGLNCCVRLNHHTGKANARNGALDQYASRGGTALPDGCRMVTVLSAVGNESAYSAAIPPAGFELAPDESGFILARPKLSYAPPQPLLWIRRRGWAFDYFIETRCSPDETRARDADKVAEFLIEELHHGRKYTPNTLEQTGKIKLPRARLRAARATLETVGRLEERDLPPQERRGRRKTYLHVAHSAVPVSGIAAEKEPQARPVSPNPPPSINPPPYREWRNGGIDAVLSSPSFLNPPKLNGGIAAEWRNSGGMAE